MFYEAPEYDFLRTNPHLKNKIVLLGYGGSHAYGTNIEGSDVDLRGCALNSREEILGGDNFAQFVNEETDTTIYSFNKLLGLLSSCNPNVIETLGLRPEHYFIKTAIGQELLDNKHLFLSQRATNAFGGYASSQLRRLDNKSCRLLSQAQYEEHILNSIKGAATLYPERFFYFPEDSIHLYIDKSEREEYDSEIFMDVHLTHYPLRDYKSMWSDMNNIVKDYSKIDKRNQSAIERGKLSKHMMHLIRLYLMCLDILEREEIVTYREKEHDFLMEIRNGKYLDEERQPVPEFFEMVHDYEKRLEYAKENTSLPKHPDFRAINELRISVNERVVRGEI